MRLTLRTMLAYMDDILEPADAEDIRKKMEDSKFASELSQRIRDCVRMLRLPAPPLQGKGLGLDANSVAKYLDNELPAERVADFEKICLESDKHLAEVASCHQILTLVLGEPADVDPVARERMYGLIDHSGPTGAPADGPLTEAPPPQAPLVAPPQGSAENAAASTFAASTFATSGAAPTGRRAKPEVPDYLRETNASRLWPVAAVMLIAFVLTAGIVAMIAPPEWRDQASSLLHGEPSDVAAAPKDAASGGPSDVVSAGNGASASGDPSSSSPKTADNGGDPLAPPSSDIARPGSALPGSGSAAPPGPAMSPAPAGAAPVLGAPDVAASTNPGIARPAGEPALLNPASPAEQSSAALTAPGSAPLTAPGATASTLPGAAAPLPGAAAPGGGGGGGAPMPGDVPPRPVAMPDAVASVSPPAGLPPAGAPGEVKPAAPAAAPATPWRTGEEMGRYTSEQDVLLKRDVASSSWRRLPPKSPVVAGDILLSLPAYRPVFNLLNGVNVQAVGPSEFFVKGIDPNGVPTIAIRYGRLIALTIGKANSQIRFEFGERSGVVTFGDSSSALAIEVNQSLLPGVDPETEVAPTIAEIFATSGSIRWEEDGHPEVIQAPAGRTLSPLPIAELAGTQLPKWIGADSLSKIDKDAADKVEKQLTPDRPISFAFKELAEHRQVEIRALASRCAGYLGQFEPIVNALGNDLEKNDWSKHIDALRAALARSPETAAQVRAAFEKHRGPDAAKLYRMLWGYTLEQFKDGAAQQLVDDLNSDSLDIRVLSFWNLQKMTDLSLFYHPENPEAKRRPKFLQWKERWREGSLVTRAAAKASSRAGRPSADGPEQ